MSRTRSVLLHERFLALRRDFTRTFDVLFRCVWIRLGTGPLTGWDCGKHFSWSSKCWTMSLDWTRFDEKLHLFISYGRRLEVSSVARTCHLRMVAHLLNWKNRCVNSDFLAVWWGSTVCGTSALVNVKLCLTLCVLPQQPVVQTIPPPEVIERRCRFHIQHGWIGPKCCLLLFELVKLTPSKVHHLRFGTDRPVKLIPVRVVKNCPILSRAFRRMWPGISRWFRKDCVSWVRTLHLCEMCRDTLSWNVYNDHEHTEQNKIICVNILMTWSASQWMDVFHHIVVSFPMIEQLLWKTRSPDSANLLIIVVERSSHLSCRMCALPWFFWPIWHQNPRQNPFRNQQTLKHCSIFLLIADHANWKSLQTLMQTFLYGNVSHKELLPGDWMSVRIQTRKRVVRVNMLWRLYGQPWYSQFLSETSDPLSVFWFVVPNDVWCSSWREQVDFEH